MEVSVFGDDLVEDMDLAMDMDLTNDNALEISGDHSYSECSNSYDNCLDDCTEFPKLYDFSESSSAHGSDSDDNSFDYKACQCSISSFHQWVLIVGVIVPPSILRSIKFFMIKIKKNVSAMAHNEYIGKKECLSYGT